jgi:hypothetical protein
MTAAPFALGTSFGLQKSNQAPPGKQGSAQQSAQMPPGKQGGAPLDIYLHGFFFTEIMGNNLVIASPEYNDHICAYWDHSDNILHPPPSDLDTQPFSWISALDTSGTKSTFPGDILQFSRGDLGANGPIISPPDLRHRYAWYLKLPLPADITGVRAGGNRQEINMSSNSRIANSVDGHWKSGGKKALSLITHLRYNTTSSIGISSINLYAEHCAEPGYKDLNDLFNQTLKVISKFDLQLSPFTEGPCLTCPPGDDYKAICELGTTVTNNPCAPCNSCPARCPKLIRTANCPQFGIVQS